MIQGSRFVTSGYVTLLQNCLRVSLLVLVLSPAGCGKLFKTNCQEDDRDCLGGGILRSNKECIRTGDCAKGLDCIAGRCKYTASTPKAGECIVTSECAQNLYCSSITLKCEPIVGDPDHDGTCDDTSQCARDLVCDLDGAELISEGPYSQIPDECREELKNADTPTHCKLPRTCKARGKVDLGSLCKASSECLPGLFCIPDPLDTDKSICYGGIELPTEPITFPLWGGAKCPSDSRSPSAYFEVPRTSGEQHDFYRLPFPNDVRRKSDGTLDLSAHPMAPATLRPQTAQRFITESQNIRGFSTNPTVFFRFSHDPRPSDLSNTTLRIVALDKTVDDVGAGAIEWQTSDRRSNYICPHWLAVHRALGSPLRSNTTYAALVTKGVKTEDGAVFTRSLDLDVLLASDRPTDPLLTKSWEAYAQLRTYLSSGAGITSSDVLNATVFTTQDATSIVPKLRTAVEEAVRSDDALVLSDITECKAGVKSPCDDGFLRVCHDQGESELFTEIHGRITLPMFQRGTPPYFTPDQGGDIPLDGERPAVQGYAKVCFALSVPKAAAPNAKLPLLIFAHGTGGSFADQMIPEAGLATWAATLPEPSAVLAIDLPVHGDRRGSSDKEPQDSFFNLMNPKAARGNALQGAADLMGLTMLAARGIAARQSPTGDDIRFDTDRIVLYGQQQGAQHAALMIGTDTRIRAAVLAAVGGNLAQTVFRQEKPVDMSTVLSFVLFDPDITTGKLTGESANPVLALMQSYVDSADPINYARELHLEVPTGAPTGHDLFMVYGQKDSFTSEENQKAYALAAGLPAVAEDLTQTFDELPIPVSGNVTIGTTRRTVALRTYDPSTSIELETVSVIQDGHFVDMQTPDGVQDVRGFLADALQGKTPTLPGPKLEVPDPGATNGEIPGEIPEGFGQ
ncbi:MAG: hypothetical protein RL701_834 [Pseudomonadota bacterium]|jgi:hypothetical protein